MATVAQVQNVAAIASLAEQGVVQAIQLYKVLQANNVSLRPLAVVLAEADSGYDALAAKAQAEIDALATKGVK